VAGRQQPCLLGPTPRLAAGEPVTSVALDMGYENPAAFTLMFRRVFGSSPLAYLGLRRSQSR
jgi:AraC-like DNA-binding protein